MHHWLDDDRFYGVACDLLGPRPILDLSEGNLHVGDTPWHGADPTPLPPGYRGQ